MSWIALLGGRRLTDDKNGDEHEHSEQDRLDAAGDVVPGWVGDDGVRDGENAQSADGGGHEHDVANGVGGRQGRWERAGGGQTRRAKREREGSSETGPVKERASQIFTL